MFVEECMAIYEGADGEAWLRLRRVFLDPHQLAENNRTVNSLGHLRRWPTIFPSGGFHSQPLLRQTAPNGAGRADDCAGALRASCGTVRASFHRLGDGDLRRGPGCRTIRVSIVAVSGLR